MEKSMHPDPERGQELKECKQPGLLDAGNSLSAEDVKEKTILKESLISMPVEKNALEVRNRRTKEEKKALSKVCEGQLI
ncbi:Protein of unknown function [Gryllus bimaculatus]|nr:Protein of unknown function [Gryllus bimaculatus]